MIGTAAAPGIMVHTLQDLFAGIASRPAHSYQLTLSYLEVYNEQIRDLLSPHPTSTQLNLREEKDGSMSIAGLTSHSPASADEVFRMLERGNARRTQSSTEANAQSSRSHAVLQVGLRMKERDGERQGSRIRLAKLSLIDLAGSERAAVSKNRGQTLKEGANINRSLLALGNCINQLAARSTPQTAAPSALSPPIKAAIGSATVARPSTRLRGKENQHPTTQAGKALGRPTAGGSTSTSNASAPAANFVPYRDSKLTRLLKDSLGGNCLTVMICNVSASSLSAEDSHNTLKYANRAKDIKLTVQRNERTVGWHVAQYEAVMRDMRAEIDDLKSKLTRTPPSHPSPSPPHTSDRSRAEEWRRRLLVQCGERGEVERRVGRIKSSLVKLGGVMAIQQDEVDCWQRIMGAATPVPAVLTTSLASHRQQRASLLTALQHSTAQLAAVQSHLTDLMASMRAEVVEGVWREVVEGAVQAAVDGAGWEVAKATTDSYSNMVSDYRQRLLRNNQHLLTLTHTIQAMYSGLSTEQRSQHAAAYQQAMSGLHASPPSHRWYDTLTEEDKGLIQQWGLRVMESPGSASKVASPPHRLSPPPPPAAGVDELPRVKSLHASSPSMGGELHFRYDTIRASTSETATGFGTPATPAGASGKSSLTGKLFEYRLTSRSTAGSKRGTLIDPLQASHFQDEAFPSNSPPAHSSSTSSPPAASPTSVAPPGPQPPTRIAERVEVGPTMTAESGASSTGRLSSLSSILTSFPPAGATSLHRRASSSIAFRPSAAPAASAQWMREERVEEGDGEQMEDDAEPSPADHPVAPAPSPVLPSKPPTAAATRFGFSPSAAPPSRAAPFLSPPPRLRLGGAPTSGLLSAPAVSVLASLPFAHQRTPIAAERPSLLAASFTPFSSKGSPPKEGASAVQSPPSSRQPASKYQKTTRLGRKMQPEGAAGEEDADEQNVPPVNNASPTGPAGLQLGGSVSTKLMSPLKQPAGFLSSRSRQLLEKRAGGGESLIPRHTPLKGKRPLGSSPSVQTLYRRG